MATTLMADLLAAVRNYLDITYVDAATDQKLTSMIEDGIFYLNDAIGAGMNYRSPGPVRRLLFDYVRYARSGASNQFWEHYRQDIIPLRQKQEVAAYEAATDDTDT